VPTEEEEEEEEPKDPPPSLPWVNPPVVGMVEAGWVPSKAAKAVGPAPPSETPRDVVAFHSAKYSK
jgi:hypothetical protein